MATAVSSAPGLPASRFRPESFGLMNTLRDPRSPNDEFPSPRGSAIGGSISNGSAHASPHPDLNVEVETLSNKLISAINHQTHLDDALASTRQQLEEAQARARRLEEAQGEHERLVTTGALVKREEVEMQAGKLLAKLAEERKRRTSVEKDKKGIEQELENLTTALFEEANEMVAAARRDRETAERKNEALRSQLRDTESLLASNQEQLAELKTVIESLQITRDAESDSQDLSKGQLGPASPMKDEAGAPVECLQLKMPASSLADIPPGPPTSFSHLISPILRTDLQAYEDFRQLMEVSKRSAPSSRVNSGTYSGVSIPGLTAVGGAAGTPSNGSTTHVSTPQSQAATPYAGSAQTPGTPAPGVSAVASPALVPLKETKFYKRAVTEDIEPTLRLDLAPGLSWLARRTVIASMAEGTMVVEPMPASQKMAVFACALCGEHRGADAPARARTHRFRTSESETAQRYPLCAYCLGRLRAACDYLGFLRLVKDGHWRARGAAGGDAEQSAWAESVRLRERMFWARVGGGVVPAFAVRGAGSGGMPRSSADAGPTDGDAKPATPLSAPPVINGDGAAHGAAPRPAVVAATEARAAPPAEHLSPLRGHPRRPARLQNPPAPDAAAPDLPLPPLPRDDWETARRAPIFDDVEPVSTPGPLTAPSPGRPPATPAARRDSLNRAGLRDSFARARPRSVRTASYERERTVSAGAERVPAAGAGGEGGARLTPAPSPHRAAAASPRPEGDRAGAVSPGRTPRTPSTGATGRFPGTPSPQPTPPIPSGGEQGLQISIPGGFDF